jgi:hypothetical protein
MNTLHTRRQYGIQPPILFGQQNHISLIQNRSAHCDQVNGIFNQKGIIIETQNLLRHSITSNRRKTSRIKEQDLKMKKNSDDNAMYLSSNYPLSIRVMDFSTPSSS